MTNREKDVEMALSLIGKPNYYFHPIWMQFASEYGWDGAPCSEIACCISYLAGNLDLIPISNYAQGLVNKFKAAGMFGTEPAVGAFVFFDYGDGNGFSHTGRVVAYDGEYVTTVEGNIGGEVVKRSYHKNTYYLKGYGYPDYNRKTEEPEKPEEPAPEPEEPKEKDYFKDVTEDMSSYKAIQWMARNGYIKGYSDGTYRPEKPLTRGQLATILWRMAGRP